MRRGRRNACRRCVIDVIVIPVGCRGGGAVGVGLGASASEKVTKLCQPDVNSAGIDLRVVGETVFVPANGDTGLGGSETRQRVKNVLPSEW